MIWNFFRKRIRARVSAMLLMFAIPAVSFAQTQAAPSDIDPRLIEIVEAVKLQTEKQHSAELRGSSSPMGETDDYAKRRIMAVMDIREASHSKEPDAIFSAIKKFQEIDIKSAEPELAKISDLYREHAELIKTEADPSEHQIVIAKYEEEGSWLEKYFAIQLSRQLFTEANERQVAFQKAQYGFQLIPQSDEVGPYIQFAKADTASILAQLHNLQGNVDFAITNSLNYLRLTEHDNDAQSAIDLINNLIFSHALSRDHDALLYLSEQLLEIEKLSTSTLPGLSELRVSQAANTAEDFKKGLKFATIASEKSKHPQISKQALTLQALSLAGLGEKAEAIDLAKRSGINLEADYLLNTEERRSTLYLGFLLAQGTDDTLARQLYNRQLDVTAQKFLANSSRDTTAMVAELENSRERQAEREAAAAREAQLQALTIDRQRKLNRSLIVLSLLLAGVALCSFVFMKFREKLLRKLEVKTVEAASAEKLKTEFLGMISHELRTPLNGIIGISDFLANYHDDPDIREKTDIILRSGNELLSVVESLTDMARLDAGQLQLAPHDADLSLSFAEVPVSWADKAQDKDLVFTHFIDPEITSHHVDEDRVLQCLDILLENAVRFTKSGRIHLHITKQDASKDDVARLTAIVADTGQGMSELVQSRLFTPFMQADTSRKRSHMGTGLNLAIAYALVKMMGGELSVISREGRGSEFKIDIPLAPAEPQTNEIALELSKELETSSVDDTPVLAEAPILDAPVLDGADAPTRGVIDLMQPHSGFPTLHDVEALVLPTPTEGRLRILVVDDMDSNRDVLRLILETQGHTCSEAADGFAALSALDQENFDLVVLDIHMTPLDGVETLYHLRGTGKAYADIPVIALTADNAASTNAACMEAGADLFLTKPVSQEELLRAISFLHDSKSKRTLSQQS